jgi:hypothetical protein
MLQSNYVSSLHEYEYGYAHMVSAYIHYVFSLHTVHHATSGAPLHKWPHRSRVLVVGSFLGLVDLLMMLGGSGVPPKF